MKATNYSLNVIEFDRHIDITEYVKRVSSFIILHVLQNVPTKRCCIHKFCYTYYYKVLDSFWIQLR